MPNKSLWLTYSFIQAPPRLGGARVVVGEEDRERLAVLVENLEDADVGLIDRQVVAFLEGDAVELGRGVEDAVDAGRGSVRSRV